MRLEETACFSGSRAEKLPFSISDGNAEYERFLWQLSAALRETAERGYRVFYTGGCTGFDILAGEMVLSMKEEFPEFQLVAVLPFEEQANTWTEFWRDKYFTMLEHCDDVITLQPRYTPGCYQRRNRYMVYRSSLVICYYDGKTGGTQSTVSYAEKLGLEVKRVRSL